MCYTKYNEIHRIASTVKYWKSHTLQNVFSISLFIIFSLVHVTFYTIQLKNHNIIHIVTYHVCHFDGFSGCICVLELRQLQIKRWWLIVGKCGWTDLYSLDAMVVYREFDGGEGGSGSFSAWTKDKCTKHALLVLRRHRRV